MESSLLGTSILDLLEADPRPSFIVARALPTHPPAVVYTNPALNNYPALLALTARKQDHDTLWKWITSPHLPSSAQASRASVEGGGSFSYLDVFWTRSIVTNEMIVVGANELPPKAEFQVAGSSKDEGLEKITAHGTQKAIITSPPSSALDGRAKSTPETLDGAVPASPKERPPSRSGAVQFFGRPDSNPGWILPDVTPEQRPFLDVINGVDWARTPLGPINTWPTKLEETFNQMLVDSRPIAIYWGPSSITIYNEAFSKLCGTQHPAMLGKPVEDTWDGAGPLLKEKLRSISLTKRGQVEDEWRFFVQRESETEGGASWQEEIYLKFQIMPIIENGEVLGFTHAAAETTSMRLWERRMKMLVDLGDVLVTARDVKSYWEKALEQLAAIEPRDDIPMAIMYSVEDDLESTSTSSPQPDPAKICRLAGTLAVPERHAFVPDTLNLGSGVDPLASIFRESLTAPHPLLIQTSDGSLPQGLLEGLQWRGFNGDRCRAAVVCPIRPARRENVMGFLLLGLNPRRPYDNDYRQYIMLLSQKLTNTLASVILLEEEARRGRTAAEQAAYSQAMLRKKLEAQTKETHESIKMFEAVAEFVPVGMCFNDVQGNITYANDAWYEITGCPPSRRIITQEAFLTCVEEEDRQKIVASYEKLTAENSRSTGFGFRVKKQADLPVIRRSPSFDNAGLDIVSIDALRERHVEAIARAERAADGTIIRVLTCLMDVTVHKRTAEEAVRRAQQAENLKRMAEFATVGMCDMDLEGRLLGANNVFFQMCGLDKVDPAKVNIKPWELGVVEDDRPLLIDKMEKMVLEGKVQNVEVRLKTTWASDDGELTLPRWVQATMMPVRSTEGIIQSFTGCLSDVSLQKWQFEMERERKDEAIRSRLQQENFIDMTSHEMRNPLSAIIHCADSITATLSKVQDIITSSACSNICRAPPDCNPDRGSAAGNVSTEPWDATVNNFIESSIDSAETIVECVQHQKRIVDDILTMSKLDSKLLDITPITADPVNMVREALKMFAIEARRVDIDLSMVVDQSYRDLKIDYLDFDPSRVKQVLINLLTNALKFTNKGPTRHVSVAISASLSRPTEATSKVEFIPRSEENGDEEEDHDRADSVFIMFEVKDTGQGLSQEQKKLLFQRFVQASSRTHVTYGGSGLGLFISRRLTELQSGQIGVASQLGVGSTFAFYVRAFRPSEVAIREANASAAAAKATALAALRTNANGNSSRNAYATSSSTGSATTPTNFSRPSTLAATPLSEMSSPSSLVRRQPPSPSLLPEVRGVLVVEDNDVNQKITRRGLENMGFIVDVANNGKECLEKLRLTDRYVSEDDDDEDESEGGGAPITLYSPPSSTTAAGKKPCRFPLSVILMDIEMPVLGGLVCTQHIRELERAGRIAGGRIPIIAVSANARIEQILKAKEAGCDDVLVKPYRLPELLERMRILMESRARE